jgi:hypothetical protein
MIASMIRFISSRRTAAVLALVLSGISLSGCASMGDGFMSGAFVDPAKYDYFDCKQLEAERTRLTKRVAELQGLIDKAGTGTGGVVVGEIAYRNEFISMRAQLKLLEDNWRRNKCKESPPAPDEAAASDEPPTKQKQKGGHSAARSIDAVH